MNLYAKYLDERQGKKLFLMPDVAFAVYEIKPPQCYIEEIFVTKESRRGKIGSLIADQIVSEAKEVGCNILLGSVAVEANGSSESAQALLAYGLKMCSADKNFIWFKKEI